MEGEILCEGETFAGEISLLFSALSFTFNKILVFLIPNSWFSCICLFIYLETFIMVCSIDTSWGHDNWLEYYMPPGFPVEKYCIQSYYVFRLMHSRSGYKLLLLCFWLFKKEVSYKLWSQKIDMDMGTCQILNILGHEHGILVVWLVDIAPKWCIKLSMIY